MRKSNAPSILEIALALVMILNISSCGPPDTLPLSKYEDIDVSVYAYDSQDNEYYLGDTTGASSCGDIAHSWAYDKGFRSSNKWGYVCCTHEDGSSCYRKIR